MRAEAVRETEAGRTCRRKNGRTGIVVCNNYDLNNICNIIVLFSHAIPSWNKLPAETADILSLRLIVDVPKLLLLAISSA